MPADKHTLTLDSPVRYCIQVPGELEDNWQGWHPQLSLQVETNADGLPVSTLAGTFDQAGLQSLLRRLYALGLPLLSVHCEEPN
jgi:hypothetical protein